MRLFVLPCLALLATVASAQSGGAIPRSAADKPDLTVTAEGFGDDSGQAVVFLYRAQDRIPKSPFRTATGAISGGKAALRIPGLPDGEYAAILLHDHNANGIIDHRFGIPREPLGYSNGWKLGLFSGMPTFAKLRFTVSDSARTLILPIVYRRKP